MCGRAGDKLEKYDGSKSMEALRGYVKKMAPQPTKKKTTSKRTKKELWKLPTCIVFFYAIERDLTCQSLNFKYNKSVLFQGQIHQKSRLRISHFGKNSKKWAE